jgi:2-succinyl-5-enolpyruvyl-6-hydroxy-3-cyclohexene-1-carboxylate synthase
VGDAHTAAPGVDVSAVPSDASLPSDASPPSDTSPASDAAAALLGALVDAGVRHVVLSPGSRSQALALTAAHLARADAIDLHVRIDERVSGFLALGIGRESGMPAAIVCTSGTAVANLLPAVLEAHHSGVPLLLLTADRPPELRGVGANQTTRQPGVYGAAVRMDADLPVPDAVDPDGTGEQTAVLRSVALEALRAALGTDEIPAGPVHLNLPYREPLAGRIPDWFAQAYVPVEHPDIERGSAAERDETWPTADHDASSVGIEAADILPEDEASGALYQGGGGVGETDEPVDDATFVLARGPRTVVIAGADAGADAEILAHVGNWPLIAEIVSGARYGRRLVHGYRQLLRDPVLGGRVERAVVFGHPTLSREVTALLSRADVEVIALRGPGEPLNLNGETASVARVAVGGGEADREWLAEWMLASRDASVDLTPPAPDAAGLSSAVPHERLGAIAAEVGVLRARVDRVALVDAVWRASWPHDRLVFGSSRLVRVADAVLPGKKVPVHANRGLGGIDGTVSTALGIAIASQARGAAGITRVLLGDLALLHDVGALLVPPSEVAPRIQVIVGNDGGGTIFDDLEVAGVAAPVDMERVMYTPQNVGLAELAAAYGWEHVVVSTRSALDQALTSPVHGPQLIEVPLER